MALDFLAEAELCQGTVIPRMMTHAAYYAMFHGARAVLLQIEGLAAPTKHKIVVSRFADHANQSADADLIAASVALSGTRQKRLLGDYDTGRRLLPAEAVKAVADARMFLETCARLHGFVPSS